MIPTNQIICGESSSVLSGFPAECIDLTVTSPPYDNLRTYKGYTFDFEAIATQLYRVTKPGGVVVWVVADATVDGSETLTSCKQKIFFHGLGFNIHDTMIWYKEEYSFPSHVRYENTFEYMFVLSRGSPKSFNPIQRINSKSLGRKNMGTDRNPNGTTRKSYTKPVKKESNAHNVWIVSPHKSRKMKEHEAPFPEALARDHIISWSNPGDVALDPFLGSGTTAKMAIETGRRYIGIDISPEYCQLAKRRVARARVPLFVETPAKEDKPKQGRFL
jgi:site-specific DNA-methyltransferase (adenine-specific)